TVGARYHFTSAYDWTRPIHLTSGKMAGLARYQPTYAEIMTRSLTTRPSHECSTSTRENGRGSWIRTNGCRDQNPVPYHLAIPLNLMNCKMTGVAGFEPTDAEIKTQCLTTWRYPCLNSTPVKNCRGSWIRTNGCRDQNQVPYHFAIPILHYSYR